MKQWKQILLLGLCLMLSGCGAGREDPDPTRAAVQTTAPTVTSTTAPTTAPAAEPTLSVREITDRQFRPAWDQGNCRSLRGDVTALVFFMDDDAGSWTGDQIAWFMEEALRPGFDYLERSAWSWGVELRMDASYFCTDDTHTIRYPGVYDPDLGSAGAQYDVPDVLAGCLGFRDRREMDRYFREYFHRDEVLYFVALSSGGTSYTMADSDPDGYDQVEYAVFFRTYTDGTPVNAFTVAHETMHFYGAEDYYDPFGTFPGRKAVAEERYPDDLMLRWAADVNELSVSDVTAYTVGWTDEIPQVLYWPEWGN